jgi:hypothetical protein
MGEFSMQHTTDTFKQRSGAFLTAASRAATQWYDSEGNWIASSLPAAARERFWLAFAPYANGAAPLADAIIRQAKTAQTPKEFSIFDPNAACVLLMQHREKMAPDVRQKLERLVEDAFGFYPGNRQPDFQFHGFNDNMPAKATLGLILGGELLGNKDAVEYGLWNLRQLRVMLVRGGINSEYNSPTYTPLTLHAIGEIAEYAQNAEARELARGIEARLWLDVAARFHPEMGIIAGPYSRAYTVDTLAHLSLLSALLWFHLGNRMHLSPMNLFEMPSDLVIHHAGDVPFSIAQFCWIAAGSFHLPEAALAMFEKKSYPFHAAAGFETGGGDPDFPGRSGHIETCLQPDFTVGTASTPMGGGEQTMSYFAAYRRNKNVQSFREVGTVYSKTVLDDDVPGLLRTPEGAPLADKQEAANYYGEEDHLVSRCNTITIQDQGAAMVLTHPHLSLGGAADGDGEPQPLNALSELIIFPSHFGGAEEIIIGGQSRKRWEGEVEHGEWIVARRGRLLIGIRPMVYMHALGPVSVALEKINDYEVIRSTFYRGEKRTFTRNELRHIFGGFVAEHAGVDEYPSLEEFAKVLSATRFTDYFWATRRVRYRRPKSTFASALDIEASWSPGTHAPRYATINGQLVQTPIVQIDGLPQEDIPFLQEEFQPVPGFFPWRDFKNIWYDLPYAIGDREE